MMQSKFDVAPPGDSTTIGPNIAYLHTIPAILKAIEFMLCIFSFALAASFKSGLSKLPQFGVGRADFLIFVMVIAWLGVIGLFLVYFLNIINKLKNLTPLVFVVLALLHLVGAFFVLISTALVLDDCISIRGSNAYRISYCDYISKYTSTSCATYEASAACGFFAFIAITFDAVLHVIKGVQEFRIYQANRAASGSGDDAPPEVSQPGGDL